MEETAEPKQAANSGFGNKKVAAKATKRGGGPPSAANAEPPQAKAESKIDPPESGVPVRTEAKSMLGLMRGEPHSEAPARGVVVASDGGGTSDSSSASEKVPAWKLALKSAAAGRAAGAAAVADVMGPTSGGDSPSKPVPAWKLRNQQAAAASTPASSSSSMPPPQTQQQEEEQPADVEESRGAEAGTPTETQSREQSFTDEDDDDLEDGDENDDGSMAGEFIFNSSRSDLGNGTPMSDSMDFVAGSKSDGNGTSSGGGFASRPSSSTSQVSGNNGNGNGGGMALTNTPVDSSAGTPGTRSGSASPFVGNGREKPSLRKAARMAQMLNRFNAPHNQATSTAEQPGGGGAVAEPKSVPAWKGANQQNPWSEVALRKAQQKEKQGQQQQPQQESGYAGVLGGGGTTTAVDSNSGRWGSQLSSPPPAPAPTPTNLSGTTTPYMHNGSSSNGNGNAGNGSLSVDNYYQDESSRPGTDLSGAYTSDTDESYHDESRGGSRRGARSGSYGRQASDSDYESGGMTDIPSGAEDSQLSDTDGDSQGPSDREGGGGAYSASRPSSAPPTLFGINMKKALSRPADRVEKAERKAERLLSGDQVASSTGSPSPTYETNQQAPMQQLSGLGYASMLSKDSLGGGQLTNPSSAYYSESESATSGTGMSGSESDRMPMRMQQRQRPEHSSKQLSTLERIMGKSNQGGGSGSSSGNDVNSNRHYSLSLDNAANKSNEQQQQYRDDGLMMGDGGGGAGGGGGRSAAEHRASAARGRDLIAQLVSSTSAGSRAGIARRGGGGLGGVVVGNDARRAGLGLDPQTVTRNFVVAAAPDDDPAPTHDEEVGASAEAAFKSALDGSGLSVGPGGSSGGGLTAPASASAATQEAAAQPPTATGGGLVPSRVESGLSSVRRDVDKLATQRSAAGLKPEKHGVVEVVLLKGSRDFLSGNKNKNQEAGESEKRFLSVSNGSIFMATYFTLLDTDGFVDCTRTKRNATSEKVCDLLKCRMEVVATNHSLCGYAIRVCKVVGSGACGGSAGGGGSKGGASSSSSSQRKEGILLRPTRMAELLEWASTMQQVVDTAAIAQRLNGESADGGADSGAAARTKGGRLFRMPGDGFGNEESTAGGRYASTKRDLWQIEQRQQAQVSAIAERLEKRATGQDPALLTGADASNSMMKALYASTNRSSLASAASAAASHGKQPRTAPRAQPLNSVFQQRPKESTRGVQGPKASSAYDDDGSDPFLKGLQRLKSTIPAVRLPPPPPPPVASSSVAYKSSKAGTLLDATSGPRIGASPTNHSIFHHHRQAGSSVPSAGSVPWLDEYRAMQRELDAMEFSTDRSLGYLANNRHKFYAMAHHEPLGKSAVALPSAAVGGNFVAPPMLVDLNRRQFARVNPSNLEAPFTLV